jgi:gamma-glutamyltranspeptidase / glutathione hydrolase
MPTPMPKRSLPSPFFRPFRDLCHATLRAGMFVWIALPVGAQSTAPVTAGGAPSASEATIAQVVAAQVAASTRGMVVSAEPLATAVGVRILEAGGNAVDAAVATAFALAVTEPSMSGIGGRTTVLLRTPQGEFLGIDGFTEVPRGYVRRPGDGVTGYGTIGIPGTVAALAAALEAHGRLGLAEVLAPAIALAEEGFPLPVLEAERIARVADDFRAQAGARSAFLKPDGSTYAAGERFRQPELAQTLRAIAAEGPDMFYKGEIARRIADDMATHGAHLTLEDLGSYQAHGAPLVRGHYRGYDLIGTFLPSSSVTTVQALQMMGALPYRLDVGTPEWITTTSQALHLAFEDRDADHGTPQAKLARLTSRAWAESRGQEIVLPAAALDPQPDSIGLTTRESAHTTHLTTADAEGWFVAMTASLGDSFGSRVVSPGLGFVYASTLQYTEVLPGTPHPRPATSQSPLIVLKDGEPILALGAAGGRRIVTAVTAVLSRVLDEGLSLEEAMAAPRLHPMGRSGVELERDPAGAAWSEDIERGVRALGFDVQLGTAFARIHAIARDPLTGALTGVADPRGLGSAGGPEADRR